MRTVQLFGGLGLLALATAGTAAAQNLVVNGDFTSNVTTAWGTENASGAGVSGSSAFDHDSGSAAVGSARISLNEAGPDSGGTVQGLSQCITSPGTAPWDFGGRLRITLDNSGNGGPNQFFIVLQFFNAGSCTGLQTTQNLVAGSGSLVSGFVDGGAVANWERLSQSGFADPMPGGLATASVRIAVRAQTDGAGDGLSVLFDSIYFGAPGTTPVELQDFDVD